MKCRKEIKKFIGCIVFLAIIFRVFCNITYLMRNTGYDRAHMVGIENEKVDMVYIGGSAAFTYWMPMKAWNDCGFTSYSYATNTIQAESILAYMKEARTVQEPRLFVIDVRAFQYYSEEADEAGIRNGTDGMDMTSVARYELLDDYFANRTFPEDSDALSYYLDIAKYHTNTGNLASPSAWGYINNNGNSTYKGWEWLDIYAYLNPPRGYETQDRVELPENGKKTLIKLLEYCKKDKLDVLFVVCPYYITQEDEEKYNTIGDIIRSYGFDYMNLNSEQYYRDIEIDFSTDYYNKNHVNLFGASKYTEYLETYIMDHYDMPDHRNDAEYASWNATYQKFAEEEKVHAATVTGLRHEVEKGKLMKEQMRASTSLAEWYEIAKDSRYTLLIATEGEICWPTNLADQQILSAWGLNADSLAQIRTVNNSTILYSNATDQMQVNEGAIGIWGDIPYRLSVENDECSMLVDGKEISDARQGIHVIVFDNNYREIADAVILSHKNGKVYLYRE